MLKKIAPSLIITLSSTLIIVMDSESHSPVSELKTRGPVNLVGLCEITSQPSRKTRQSGWTEQLRLDSNLFLFLGSRCLVSSVSVTLIQKRFKHSAWAATPRTPTYIFDDVFLLPQSMIDRLIYGDDAFYQWTVMSQLNQTINFLLAWLNACCFSPWGVPVTKNLMTCRSTVLRWSRQNEKNKTPVKLHDLPICQK